MNIILQDKWADGWTILAVPEEGKLILKYEELKKEIRNLYSDDYENFIKSSSFLAREELPFTGGWVGFFSYDLGTRFLNIHQKTKDDLHCPEVYFAYCDKAFLKDPNGNWWFVQASNGTILPLDSKADCEHFIKYSQLGLEGKNKLNKKTFPKSNLTFQQYQNKIAKIKKYLFDGDTYQVNLSQRFLMPFLDNPFEVFQKVSQINPSPYQFFCEDKKFAVISNSPELLIRGTNKKGKILLETRPIKGTIQRGKNTREDAKKIKKLLASKKDEAELAMIVDLERNDLGKVCEAGSVRVSKHREIQKYSHVIHTISTVNGVLEKNKDVFDVIEAVFPGGSITGCPKKRTMQIIDELEDFKRGVYCGSAGYISLNGNFEFNIMIRTMFAKNNKIYFNSGGGIVVDSDAKFEYEETLDKAKALTQSLFISSI